MPWNKVDLMSQRLQLVEKLLLPRANVSKVCLEHNISRKTAYKWLDRYAKYGLDGLLDESKAPKHCQHKTDSHIEAIIITTHNEHPYWGPRKIKNFLLNEKTLEVIPSSTTIGRILERNHCEIIKSNKSHPATKRFEKHKPNEMWQMDFKGSFATELHRCYPLTVIDDYSRYNIGLNACLNEKTITVKSCLIEIFKEYGLPEHINVDNGNPWGPSSREGITKLEIWLLKQGIRLTHSAPYHPQTNGKIERFHRTLKLEVLHKKRYASCTSIQRVFDEWRHKYNFQRPHDALSGQAPAMRYRQSHREYTDKLFVAEYASGDIVKKVQKVKGTFSFKGNSYNAGKGLGGEYIAIRETDENGVYSIFFMDTYIRSFKLKNSLS